MTKKNTYELINPSDACTLQAREEKDAVAVAMLLGEGAYGLKRLPDDVTVGPVLLFADEETTLATIQQIFGMSLGDYLTGRSREIAEVCESFLYGSERDRAFFDHLETLFDQQPIETERASYLLGEARAQWNAQRRSSLNDIGARALEMARLLRKKTRVDTKAEERSRP